MQATYPPKTTIFPDVDARNHQLYPGFATFLPEYIHHPSAVCFIFGDTISSIRPFTMHDKRVYFDKSRQRSLWVLLNLNSTLSLSTSRFYQPIYKKGILFQPTVSSGSAGFVIFEKLDYVQCRQGSGVVIRISILFYQSEISGPAESRFLFVYGPSWNISLYFNMNHCEELRSHFPRIPQFIIAVVRACTHSILIPYYWLASAGKAGLMDAVAADRF